MEMYLEDCTVDSMDLRAEGGSITVRNVVADSAFLRSTRASVYVIDTQNAGRGASLSFRQVSNAVCLRGGDVSGVALEPAWASGKVSDRQRQLAVGQFDENKDFFVTVDELGTGLTNIGRCCGSACPFRSWCASLQFRLFPSESQANAAGANSIAGRTGIVTDTVFVDRLLEFTNDTSLMPLYYRGATFTPASPDGTSSSWTVRPGRRAGAPLRGSLRPSPYPLPHPPRSTAARAVFAWRWCPSPTRALPPQEPRCSPGPAPWRGPRPR